MDPIIKSSPAGNNVSSSDGRDLSRSEALRGRSTSFAVGGTAWMVAIFCDRTHCVDTSRSLDHHRTALGKRRGLVSRALILIERTTEGSLIVRLGPLNLPDLHRTAGVARSSCDRGPIVARSWLLQRQFGSHDAAKGNYSHDPIKPLPRPHQTARIFRPKSSLKRRYILLCSSSFD